MTDKEQIIINGIDVSECDHFREGYCHSGTGVCHKCDTNCQYAALYLKEQLKSQISSLRVNKGYVIQKLLQIAEFSLEEEDILDKDGNLTGKKKLRDTSAGLKALESLCKYLGFNASASEGEYRQAKIITISNLDDDKI